MDRVRASLIAKHLIEYFDLNIFTNVMATGILEAEKKIDSQNLNKESSE